MSDFFQSSEDIDFLINGKIPLIISQNRSPHTAYQFCTILFWRSTRTIQNRLHVHWLSFHADLLFPFQKIKNLALLDVQIYIHQERIQTKRVTSSTTYFFLRFCFDDEPFYLKIFTGERIYLRFASFYS